MKSLAILAGAAAALCASAALAASSLPVSPAVDFVSPFVAAVLSVVAPAVVGWGIYELRKLTGITLSAAQSDKLESWAANEAGVLVAGAADNLAGKTFTVSSPEIAAIAAKAEKDLPGVAAALGVTPDAVKRLVVGQIGKLQANQPATSKPAG